MQKKFVLTILGVLFILGVTSNVNGAAASIAATQSIDLGTAVLNFYESFQWAMRVGCPAVNLPIMEPFKLPFVPFEMTSDSYSFVGNVTNMYVSGLSNFRLIGGSFDSQALQYRATYDVLMPDMQLLGEYMLDAWTLVGGYRLAWSGNGMINTKLIDYRGVGEMTLSPFADNPNGLYVSDFKLKFYLGDIAVNNWNNLWSIARNNYVNRHLHDFAMMAIEEIDWTTAYGNAFLTTINSQLANMTMDQLVNAVIGMTAPYSKANCLKSTNN